MPESEGHKRLKRRDAGKTGKTEVQLPSGAIIDALSGTRVASEIERGGPAGIRKSVESLGEALDTGIARKVRLRVPQPDIPAAVAEMRRQRIGGEVTNLGGTEKVHVPKRRK